MSTIAEIRKSRLRLGVRCDACTRSVSYPHQLVPARLAADLPVHLAAAFFRCGGCGSKKLTSYIENENGVVPFSAEWKKQRA